MKKRKLILPLIALGVLIYSIIGIFQKDGYLIRPKLIKVDKVFSSLEKQVSNSLSGTKGKYAVVIKNMGTGKGYTINENSVFESASLYKLWVMGTVLDKIQKGDIKEDEILSQEIKVLNEKFEINEEDAELKEGEITMSVANALNQMITISHNYAALLLVERVKNSQVKEFMESLGLNESDLGIPPTTTASNTALFLEKLYKKQIVNEEYSQRMIDLLKEQQLNDGLPKYLPNDIEIAHKTGEIGWLKHDAGIVFTSKGDYIIVVLSESDSPADAQERIAHLSKAVYEYFNK